MEENLKEKLFKPTKAGWERADEREREAIFNLSKKYMNFLNVAKTERVNKKTKYYVTFLFFERQNDKWVKTSVVEFPNDNPNKPIYGQLIPLNENTLIWNCSLGLYRISYE